SRRALRSAARRRRTRRSAGRRCHPAAIDSPPTPGLEIEGLPSLQRGARHGGECEAQAKAMARPPAHRRAAAPAEPASQEAPTHHAAATEEVAPALEAVEVGQAPADDLPIDALALAFPGQESVAEGGATNAHGGAPPASRAGRNNRRR